MIYSRSENVRTIINKFLGFTPTGVNSGGLSLYCDKMWRIENNQLPTGVSGSPLCTAIVEGNNDR